jgi:hypothetical protein
MKKLILKIIFHIALAIVRGCINNNTTRLTPDHLLEKGFVCTHGSTFIEPDVKARDLVTVVFEKNYYRVYHSDNMIFIAVETSKEWFDTYYMILHPDNRFKR